MAGLGEQVAAEGHDEPGLLGHLHELGGGEQAPLGVLPAHEGLEARHPVVPQVDDRLVVHDQPALVDGPAQAGLGVEPVQGPVPQGVVEDLGPVPAAGLGPVHGGVGVPHQGVGTGSRRVSS